MTDNSTENEDALFLGTDTNVYANEFFAILNGEDKEKTRAAQQDHMRDGINNIHESAKEENKGNYDVAAVLMETAIQNFKIAAEMTLGNAGERDGIMKNVKMYELKRKQLQLKMRTKLASLEKTPSRKIGGSFSKSNIDYRTGLWL